MFVYHHLPTRVFSVLDKDCPLKEEEIQINILVYLSALIPKSFGSILTSLVIELCKSDNVSLFVDVSVPESVSYFVNVLTTDLCGPHPYL